MFDLKILNLLLASSFFFYVVIVFSRTDYIKWLLFQLPTVLCDVDFSSFFFLNMSSLPEQLSSDQTQCRLRGPF